ncbi:hypothetical protein KEM56_004162, partial [Ascosphaera pollenicola]
GLDAQCLRIHEVSSLRLVAEHALAPKEQLLSLDWGLAEGPAAAAASASAKKRRRTSSVSSSSASVVAFGTNTGAVKIYSPAENKLVAVLDGQHDRPVVDVKFTAGSSDELYSLAADGKLCRWDVKSAKCTKSITLPSTAVSTLSRPVSSDPPVLAASQTPFLVHLDPAAGAGADSIVSFAAMKNTIHTLIPSSSTNLANAHFLAADSDRYINLFDIEKRKLLGNLVATKEVEALALSLSNQKNEQQQTQLLAAITRDGTVEFFAHPFTLSPGAAAAAGAASSASLKAQRKSQTRRCSASLTIRRPNSASPVPLIAAQFAADGDLLVAYVENGVVPIFEKVKVVDEESGEIAWSGKKEVVREKVNALAANANAINAGVNGVAGREVRVDESRTVVESGIGGNDGMDIDDEEEEEEEACMRLSSLLSWSWWLRAWESRAVYSSESFDISDGVSIDATELMELESESSSLSAGTEGADLALALLARGGLAETLRWADELVRFLGFWEAALLFSFPMPLALVLVFL